MLTDLDCSVHGKLILPQNSTTKDNEICTSGDAGASESKAQHASF